MVLSNDGRQILYLMNPYQQLVTICYFFSLSIVNCPILCINKPHQLDIWLDHTQVLV